MLVPNVTTAINCVMKSLVPAPVNKADDDSAHISQKDEGTLKPGDSICHLSTEYGGPCTYIFCKLQIL